VVLARMSKWNFKKDKRKEAFLELDNLLNTLIHQTKGFRGDMSLLSQDLNSATILTLWADIEALNTSEKEVFTKLSKKSKIYLKALRKSKTSWCIKQSYSKVHNGRLAGVNYCNSLFKL
jgi:hypothetical protein